MKLPALPVEQEKKLSMHSFIMESYSHTKKHIEQGVSYLKKEISGFREKSEGCFSNILLPVNNFLKDLSQIDNELELERKKELLRCSPYLEGYNAAIADWFSPESMEENY